jgi:hypothetical protein
MALQLSLQLREEHEAPSHPIRQKQVPLMQ